MEEAGDESFDGRTAPGDEGSGGDPGGTPAVDDTSDVSAVRSPSSGGRPADRRSMSETTKPFLPEDWRAPTGPRSPSDGGGEDRSGRIGADRRPDDRVFAPAPDLTSSPAVVPAPRRPGLSLPWLVAVVVAAVLGGVVGGGIVAATSGGGDNVTTIKEFASGPAMLNGVTNIQTVIAKVQPAVVSIDATSAGTCNSTLGCNLDGGGVQEEQGTGMVVTSDGEVVTNNHVIAGASSISVTLFGSLKPLAATLVDTDPTNDVALLKIQNASNLPTVVLGDSDDVQVGDAVVAIGNALGLSAGTPTVTQGIISAKGRTVQASDESGTTSETLTNMFQTDAAINPGNSGGPLVSSSGRVIAMNTAVASNEQGTSEAQNIGFAIPVNKIEQLLPALRAESIGNKGYLGVSLETLTTQVRNQYDFTPTQGAVVLQVTNGSPAEGAGLREGDVIVSFDGKPVTSADRLGTAIQDATPGTSVAIGLYRGSARLTYQITLDSGTATTPSG